MSNGEMKRKLQRSLSLFVYTPVWEYPRVLTLLPAMALAMLLARIAGGRFTNRIMGRFRVSLSIRGATFSLPPAGGDIGVVFDCLVDKMYEKEKTFIPGDGDVCLDIGANIGACSAVWYQRCKPDRVIAAEPHPQTCKRLRVNAALNQWNGFTIEEAAVSDTNGEVSIALCAEGSMATVTSGGGSNVSVPSITIDALFEKHELASVDICKIDVEGHETSVLKGAQQSLPRIKHLIIEYHSPELRKALLAQLQDYFEIVSCDSSAIGLIYAKNRVAPRREY